MDINTELMLISWGASIVFALGISIMAFIVKDKEAFENSLYFLLVAITPFGVIIPALALIMGIAIAIVSGGEYLFKRITKNW